MIRFDDRILATGWRLNFAPASLWVKLWLAAVNKDYDEDK